VHAERDGTGRVVAVVSPKGGCGKTTVALNLALSLARQGRSVVLVDADVNGDVLSSIDARSRATLGAFDLVLGGGSADAALLNTVLPNFRILAAVGSRLPPAEQLSADHTLAWRVLLAELARRVEVVIVDTPAGMFGVTHQILSASSHVVGVLQAEQIAARSFERFSEGLQAVPQELRPSVAGIVVNMLQTRQDASMSVFQSACQDLPAEWLFDTSIPRHGVFLDSTHAGVPLRHLDDQVPPAVAWLFDNLAAEVVDRLALASTGQRRPRPLLA
jgi:cellulose biosynthesis protein BcsQ